MVSVAVASGTGEPLVPVIRSVQVPWRVNVVVFTVSVELPGERSARGHCIHAPVPDDGGSPHAGQSLPVTPLGVFGADSRTLRTDSRTLRSCCPDASDHDDSVM
jgi:hypothetical protein